MKVAYVLSGRSFDTELVLAAQEQLGWRPVMWLGDQRHIAFARRRFSGECYSFGYSDFLGEGGVAVGPTEVPYSPAVVEKYEAFISSAEFRYWEPMLLGELNRLTELRFMRLVDREVRVREIVLALVSRYVASEPDLFYARETPHNVVDLSAFYLAKYLGIPTLFFQPTSTIGPNLVARTDLDQFFQMPRSTSELVQTGERSVSVFRSAVASELLAGLGEGGPPVRMLAELRTESEKRQVARERRIVIRGRTNSSVFFWRRLKSLVGLGRRFRGGADWDRRIADILYAGWQKAFIETVGRLPSGDDPVGWGGEGEGFAVFPLHYQPERTSIPEGSPFAFQGDVVAQARATLRPDITLVVKEHASQVSKSRSGYLGRSKDFYRLVGSLPNTKIVGVDWPLKERLGQATVCFTMTGSIGVEAALAGVPVVYFGNPWWSGMPGSTRFERDAPLPEASTDPDERRELADAAKDFLLSLVGERAIAGFGTPSQERFWSAHLDLPPEFREVELASAIAVMAKFTIRLRELAS